MSLRIPSLLLRPFGSRTTLHESQKGAALPAELLLYIFELASYTSRTTCKTLCLVSSLARRGARPCLFETVVLRESSWSDLATALSWIIRRREALVDKPIRATLVRNIWASNLPGGRRIAPFLLACANVRNLALDEHGALDALLVAPQTGDGRTPPNIRLSIIDRIGHAWRSDMELKASYSLELRTRLFPGLNRVTHLAFLHTSFRIREDLRVGVFLRLSHLEVPYDYFVLPERFERDLKNILREAPNLSMLVVNMWSETRLAKLLAALQDREESEEVIKRVRALDPRIRVIERSDVDLRLQWEEEIAGGASPWNLL